MYASSIAAIFTAWEMKYREEPEFFASIDEKAGMATAAYGWRAARYFIELAADLGINLNLEDI